MCITVLCSLVWNAVVDKKSNAMTFTAVAIEMCAFRTP